MKKTRILIVALAMVIMLTVLPVQAEESFFGLTKTLHLYGNMYDHYTGPATVKAVLNYLTGQNWSQEEVARSSLTNEKGTYLKNMVAAINASQDFKKVAHYTGNDFDTVIYSLYDTVVRRDTPAIIGVNSSVAKGWPHDMSKAKFVLVYQVSGDLSQFKIADPRGISDGGEVKSFYTVSAKALYDAYIQANTGLTYGIDGGRENDPQPIKTIDMTIDPVIQNKQNLDTATLTYTNNGNVSASTGVMFSLQRWNSGTLKWEDVKIPEGIMWPAMLINLKAGESYEQKVGWYLQEGKAGAGTYRVVKVFQFDEPSAGELTVYSNNFVYKP